MPVTWVVYSLSSRRSPARLLQDWSSVVRLVSHGIEYSSRVERSLKVTLVAANSFLISTPTRLNLSVHCKILHRCSVVLCGCSKFRIKSNSYFSIRFDAKQAQLFEIFKYLPSPISYLFNRMTPIFHLSNHA